MSSSTRSEDDCQLVPKAFLKDIVGAGTWNSDLCWGFQRAGSLTHERLPNVDRIWWSRPLVRHFKASWNFDYDAPIALRQHREVFYYFTQSNWNHRKPFCDRNLLNLVKWQSILTISEAKDKPIAMLKANTLLLHWKSRPLWTFPATLNSWRIQTFPFNRLRSLLTAKVFLKTFH